MIYFPFFLALRAGAFGLGGGLCSLSRFLNCYLEQLPLAMKDMAKGTGNNWCFYPRLKHTFNEK